MDDNPLRAMRAGYEGSARFLEMADAYDHELRTSAVAAAQRAAIPLERGVLACVSGPVYETAAEAEMLRRLGAQAVNMSVVPEVIAARGLKQRVLGLAVLTNRSGVAVGHSQVLAIAEDSCKTITCLLDGLFERFPT
jgi:purine-nucleoside phosphorylase